MDKINILISCHKASDTLQTDVFRPIQVGTAVNNTFLEGMLHDNEGDNISALNQMYCELTAQYWAWKNLDLEYYGFCHYRRYFNFSGKKYKEDEYGNILEPYLDHHTIKKYHLSDQYVRQLTENYDVIITEKKKLKDIPGDFRTPREHYRAARYLRTRDFEEMLAVIDEISPEYSVYAKEFAEGTVSCFCNMFIMKREYFFEYCEWVFRVLEEFCRRTDMTHYSTEALRTPGHLAERLLNIYLMRLMDRNSEIKIKELQCVEILKTDPQEKTLQPAFTENSIPVVFAANNRFVPVFAACFHSLAEHAGEQHNYDIVLIESDITADNKAALLRMTEGKDNISLRFYDPGQYLRGFKLKANAHITVETFYRFLIQEVMSGYDKVLYLDCDIIIRRDVAELYQTDLGDNMVAAVKDVDFQGQVNGALIDAMDYCRKTLKMEDPYHYFQAGVLLFNTRAMRDAHSLKEWLTFASQPYRYSDQDVLNIYCENRVKYLDMSWNVIFDCDHTRIKDIISFAPDELQKEYKNARKDPKIIHYAGFMKPWYNPSEDYAYEFWKSARETEFYEELLYRMSRLILDKTKKKEIQNLDEPWHNRMLDSVMPHGTRRRRTLDNMYVKVRGLDRDR